MRISSDFFLSRPAILTIVVVAASVAVAAIFFVRTPDEQTRDAAVRTVDLRPGGTFADSDGSITFYERTIRDKPDVSKNHTGLAHALLQRAGETGREFSLVPRAEKAIDRALELDPHDVHARILKATLLNKLHRFEDALDVSDRILSVHADMPAALSVRIDALVELGRYDEAVQTSDRLLAVKPGLPAYSRAAYLRGLHGDTAGAEAAMELAAGAGVPGSADRSWALVKLAEMAIAEGEFDRARRILEGTLEERMQYPPALGGLAHLALVENDLERAEFLAGQVRSLTDGTAPLEILLEVYRLRGDADAAAEIADAIEHTFKRASDMGEIVRMEYADFLLDEEKRLHRALDWAAVEYERRPNHLHAGETYAWALHKTGRHEEAANLIEDVLSRSPEDPMLEFRAARIHRAAGNEARAFELARTALQGGLHLESPLTAREAAGFLKEAVGHY